MLRYRCAIMLTLFIRAATPPARYAIDVTLFTALRVALMLRGALRAPNAFRRLSPHFVCVMRTDDAQNTAALL